MRRVALVSVLPVLTFSAYSSGPPTERLFQSYDYHHSVLPRRPTKGEVSTWTLVTPAGRGDSVERRSSPHPSLPSCSSQQPPSPGPIPSARPALPLLLSLPARHASPSFPALVPPACSPAALARELVILIRRRSVPFVVSALGPGSLARSETAVWDGQECARVQAGREGLLQCECLVRFGPGNRRERVRSWRMTRQTRSSFKSTHLERRAC